MILWIHYVDFQKFKFCDDNVDSFIEKNNKPLYTPGS